MSAVTVPSEAPLRDGDGVPVVLDQRRARVLSSCLRFAAGRLATDGDVLGREYADVLREMQLELDLAIEDAVALADDDVPHRGWPNRETWRFMSLLRQDQEVARRIKETTLAAYAAAYGQHQSRKLALDAAERQLALALSEHAATPCVAAVGSLWRIDLRSVAVRLAHE